MLVSEKREVAAEGTVLRTADRDSPSWALGSLPILSRSLSPGASRPRAPITPRAALLSPLSC